VGPIAARKDASGIPLRCAASNIAVTRPDPADGIRAGGVRWSRSHGPAVESGRLLYHARMADDEGPSSACRVADGHITIRERPTLFLGFMAIRLLTALTARMRGGRIHGLRAGDSPEPGWLRGIWKARRRATMLPSNRRPRSCWADGHS